MVTIGLSRSATLVLAQLVEAHNRGAECGLSEDQLGFRLSIRQGRTTIQFARDELPLQTSDPNAIVVLRANGLIEPLNGADHDGAETAYIVTQAGLTTIQRTALGVQPDKPEIDAG